MIVSDQTMLETSDEDIWGALSYAAMHEALHALTNDVAGP